MRLTAHTWPCAPQTWPPVSRTLTSGHTNTRAERFPARPGLPLLPVLLLFVLHLAGRRGREGEESRPSQLRAPPGPGAARTSRFPSRSGICASTHHCRHRWQQHPQPPNTSPAGRDTARRSQNEGCGRQDAGVPRSSWGREPREHSARPSLTAGHKVAHPMCE